MKRELVALMLLPFAISLAACLDDNPITVTKEGGISSDAGFVDAPLEDDAYLYPECRACIAAPNDPGPGCGTELQALLGAMLGKELFDCAYVNGCVNKLTYGESLVCALPCAEALGIEGVYHPAILGAIDVSKCLHDFCGKECERGP